MNDLVLAQVAQHNKEIVLNINPSFSFPLKHATIAIYDTTGDF
jgi:hypothetical protein